MTEGEKMRLVDRKSVNVVVVDGDFVGGLVNSNTNATELKILYNFIDRIDCTKNEKQTVIFEGGEVERFFECSDVSRENMKRKALRLGKTFKLLSSKNKNVFSIIQVFEKIAFGRGEDGFGKLELTCTQTAIETIFNPESIEHFKYKLKFLPMLTNKFSALLFLHLEDIREQNEDNAESEIKVKYTIDELREILKCSPDTYPKFSDFNQKVLKRCHSDINSNTLLRFDYEPTDKDENRYYTAVEFTVGVPTGQTRFLA